MFYASSRRELIMFETINRLDINSLCCVIMCPLTDAILSSQVGHNSYPNVMALLAGEPDADQAEEECKQKVRFSKEPGASSEFGLIHHHPLPHLIFYLGPGDVY